jgi:hypothetical protein
MDATTNLLPDDPTERAELLSLCQTILDLNAGSSSQVIAAHLESLALYYPTKTFSPGEAKIWVAGWVESCGHIPPDIFRDACRQWREGTSSFYPTPGQILALAAPLMDARRNLSAIAASVLTWPITEVEYRGVTFAVPPGGTPLLWGGSWHRPGVAQQLEWIEKRRRFGWDEKWGPEPECHDTRIWPSVIAYVVKTAPWYLRVSAAPNAEWRASFAVRMDQP